MSSRSAAPLAERPLSVVDQSFGSASPAKPPEQAGDRVESASRVRRRLLSGLVYLLLTLVAIAVVVPQFLGHDKDQVIPLLQNVRVEYLALVILLETIRYTCFGLVARRLANGLGRQGHMPSAKSAEGVGRAIARPLPTTLRCTAEEGLRPLRRRDVIQMMLASYALARIFSAGGATGFLVRVQFYLRQGLTVGRTLALFIAQNVVSSIALLIVYLFGISVLWQRGDLTGLAIVAAAGWFVLALAVGAVQVAAGLRPDLIEQWLHRALDYARAHGALLSNWTLPAFIELAVVAAALGALWLSGASQFVEQLSAASVTVAGLLSAALLASTFASARMRVLVERHVGQRLHSALHSRLAQRDASQKFTHDLSEGVRHALGERSTLLGAFAFQATGLCADIAALVIAFQALQVPLQVPVIVAAYIIAYYAQLIAPTPGEAGAMEFALLGVLVGLGVSPLNATTTTLLYRFVSFWLPIPFGVLAYLNLKRSGKV
jgi:uncharacterized membrane protein YbhN (UPF0104 family)